MGPPVPITARVHFTPQRPFCLGCTLPLRPKGPKGGLQAGRTDTQPRSEPFEQGDTKPLSLSRSTVAGECRDPDGGVQTIPKQTAACTQTETQPTACKILHQPRRNPGRCEAAGTAWGNLRHGRLRLRVEVLSRRGQVGLAKSALPASPSSQKG
eukprot:884979-Pyramimonas_sp.AAC.1